MIDGNLPVVDQLNLAPHRAADLFLRHPWQRNYEENRSGNETYRLLFFPMADRMSCRPDSARANILVMVPKLTACCSFRCQTECPDSTRDKYTSNGTKLTACCSFPWQTGCPDSARAKILVMVPKLTTCCSFPWQTECPDSARANILVMVANLPLAVLSHGRQNVLTLQEQIY
jgi:hypothetical protein